jgi:hypothetical protein
MKMTIRQKWPGLIAALAIAGLGVERFLRPLNVMHYDPATDDPASMAYSSRACGILLFVAAAIIATYCFVPHIEGEK